MTVLTHSLSHLIVESLLHLVERSAEIQGNANDPIFLHFAFKRSRNNFAQRVYPIESISNLGAAIRCFELFV